MKLRPSCLDGGIYSLFILGSPKTPFSQGTADRDFEPISFKHCTSISVGFIGPGTSKAKNWLVKHMKNVVKESYGNILKQHIRGADENWPLESTLFPLRKNDEDAGKAAERFPPPSHKSLHPAFGKETEY